MFVAITAVVVIAAVVVSVVVVVVVEAAGSETGQTSLSLKGAIQNVQK